MNSTWTALRNPAFRKLWIAAVISGTCVAAHDNAATWMMNTFTESPLLLSLMSTVASLPFFLLTVPAGALADKVDRQKLICTINVCLAATAFTLAVLGWMHLLNPYLILGSVFFIGVGFTANAPAWTSILPQVVSEAELASAATLNGLQFNISGIIGPVLGGLLIPFAGANFVFALNAACFLFLRCAQVPPIPQRPDEVSQAPATSGGPAGAKVFGNGRKSSIELLGRRRFQACFGDSHLRVKLVAEDQNLCKL
jgi:MFS family permease